MYFNYKIPEYFKWFPQARFGMFIHWGPYAALGRGEQVLFREHLDHAWYEKQAIQWNPQDFDPAKWALTAKNAGMKYACLTTRHHDGYCLWDSAVTNYTSAKQAPKRDLVCDYVEAFRAQGLKVGFYYSWCDWRISAYYDGPQKDPAGWSQMREYMHAQVRELLTKYGTIDYFFFDGVWPRCAEELGSSELLAEMRSLQPNIIINNRLGFSTDKSQLAKSGGGNDEGDFGTPEHVVTPENRLWESNQVSFWRWWGFHAAERWKTTDQILDLLCSCATQGGNLLLNVGPDGQGRLPEPFCKSASRIGKWLEKYGDAIYGNEGGDMTESLSYGYQSIKGNKLYLILRFYRGGEMRIADLVNPVQKVTLLTTGQELEFSKDGDNLLIRGLPKELDEELFPVICIETEGKPATNDWGGQRLWQGNPERIADWARSRKKGFNVL
jgi:alpha-L-fucosidase